LSLSCRRPPDYSGDCPGWHSGSSASHGSAPFGVNVQIAWDVILQSLAGIGIRWLGMDEYRDRIETRQGVFDWRAVDAMLLAMVSYRCCSSISATGVVGKTCAASSVGSRRSLRRQGVWLPRYRPG
jgi:hypothetical protein